MRDTRQRRAIRAALAAVDRPLGPKEILAAAKRRAPRLGVATIYRNLRAMLDAGEIVQVELPAEAPRFELSGKKHHHHFQCRACGRAYELEGCASGLRIMMPRGFELERHEIVLYGRCATCAA